MNATLEIAHDGGDWPTSFSELAVRAATAALSGVGLDAGAFEISVLACDDLRIAQLNGAFRKKGQPTNVLSWPSEERGVQNDGDMPDMPELPMDAELGDIAISYDTCAREAVQAGKPFDHLSLIHI